MGRLFYPGQCLGDRSSTELFIKELPGPFMSEILQVSEKVWTPIDLRRAMESFPHFDSMDIGLNELVGWELTVLNPVIDSFDEAQFLIERNVAR